MKTSHRLARALRSLANRVDPPVIAAAAPPTNTAVDLEGARADRFLDDLILRDALHRALNRYQPFRPPARA